MMTCVIISRKEARERGLKRYFTGKPCKHGHLCERYIGTGHCIECDNARSRDWHHQHKEFANERSREWGKQHRDSLRIYFNDWRSKNADRENKKLRERRKIGDVLIKHNKSNADWREKNHGYMSEWKRKNPEKHKAIVHKRRSLKKNSGGTVSPDQIKEIYRLQNGKCAYCRQSLKNKYQLDHITPLAKDGRNEAKNIQLLCAKRKGSCNQRKSAKDPIDFARSLGLLL